MRFTPVPVIKVFNMRIFFPFNFSDVIIPELLYFSTYNYVNVFKRTIFIFMIIVLVNVSRIFCFLKANLKSDECSSGGRIIYFLNTHFKTFDKLSFF